MHSVTDPGNCEERNKNTKSGRKPQVERYNVSKQRQQLPAGSGTPPKFKKQDIVKKEEASMNKQATLAKPNKPSFVKPGFERPAKPSFENKAISGTKLQKKSELAIQRPPVPKQNVCSTLLDVLVTCGFGFSYLINIEIH